MHQLFFCLTQLLSAQARSCASHVPDNTSFLSPNTRQYLSAPEGTHCYSACCKAGPERRKATNTLREGPKTSQDRQDEMLSGDVAPRFSPSGHILFVLVMLWILP